MGLVVSISLWLGTPWLISAVVLAPLVYGFSIFLLGIVKRDELLILAGVPGVKSASGMDTVGQPFVKTEVIR
jgi:ABC-type sulfate transport system permease subunit